MDGSNASESAAPGIKSFGDLYAEVAPRLVAWATIRIKRSLRNWVEPDDIVQETAARGFERFREFDATVGNFSQWTFGIANNVLRESLAQAARPDARAAKSAESSRDVLELVPDDITSVSGRLMRDESFRALLDKLDLLDDEEQRLLALLGFEGLGHEETARLMAISVDACEKRWQRLRRKIAEWRPPADLFAR
jgi:RNA polymerase sigma factor (sigma-70 family)